MTYTTGIPRSGQSLGNSRPQIQGNFDYINTAFAINHVAFNAAGFGKHKFVQMPERDAGSNPIPTTAANEGALYTKEAQSITNLFWRQESNGTEIQMTNIAPSSSGNGYTFLPGALLIQWGEATKTNGQTTNFPIAFSSTPYSLVVTVFQNTTNRHFAYVRSATNTGFVTTNLDSGGSGETNSFKWIAIGPKA